MRDAFMSRLRKTTLVAMSLTMGLATARYTGPALRDAEDALYATEVMIERLTWVLKHRYQAEVRYRAADFEVWELVAWAAC